MSTSKTYQQSLADAGSETRPPMLERGSYIPWASRFRRYLNRKRDNRKWLLKALDEGPYVFRQFTPTGATIPRLQTVDDLEGDDLLYYDAEMEVMNMILLSIPNEIYNSVDILVTSAKDICLQPEWLKYVTQVRLAKQLTVDSFNGLFDYLSQYKKLVNALRAKKLEKSHGTLALVAHTGSSSRNTSSYYVTHPSSIIDYDEEYQQDDVHNHSENPIASAMLLLDKDITQNFSNPTNNHLRASSNTKNQAIVQGDRVNIQSKNSGNIGRNNKRTYVQEEVVEGMNASNETGNIQRALRTSTSGNTSTVQCYNCPKLRNDFLFADALRMEEIEELSANIGDVIDVDDAKRFLKAEKLFFKIETQSKTLDTTSVVFKSKIDVESASNAKDKVVQIVLWVVDSGCSKHMTGDRSLLRNFIEKFMGTVRFGNDNFAAITGYGDYIHGNITICHVYYVEGLGHNLFSVGQFCDGDLEWALLFYKCYIRNGKEMICSLADAISFLYYLSLFFLTWLLLYPSVLCPKQLQQSHGYGIEDCHILILDHLCYACERGKSKKASHPPKLVSSDHSKLELLHMDLCGPMRVASINGKKYILVIVDEFSRYTWVYFLRSKDETPEIIKKFIAQAQLNYKAKVCKIRTDNDTELKNATLKAHLKS
ncbi:retrovirus-related pol polyprotein from transposon TNT 1-94 [Tanacetum coccineum]|uniref:Retrovirus-related pol polyprotein from transposon TNT 1-94 n=1 Tax=Tanacetum coccineum TaxID=301880 RepID=A0ABQ5BJU5_9ASTR